MTAFLALLRGINVGGKNKLPMHGLRELCRQLGWCEVRTYIQSGNVLFRSDTGSDRDDRTAQQLEAALEGAIQREYGLSIPVLVRSSRQWHEYQDGNPFPMESGREPKLVMLALAQSTPRDTTVQALRERAAAGERIERVGDAIWIHFPEGSGRSRLTPTLLDSAAGSPVTTRNWRTVTKLALMTNEPAGHE